MLSFLGTLSMARLDVSLEHALVVFHNGFPELMNDMLSFLIVKPRCSDFSFALNCRLPVSFGLLHSRKGVC